MRGAGLCGELLVSGDEVGVQMGFDDVFDAQAVLGGGLEINVDIALRVDDGGDAVGPDQIRGVGQTSEVELFEYHLDETIPRASATFGAFLAVGSVAIAGVLPEVTRESPAGVKGRQAGEWLFEVKPARAGRRKCSRVLAFSLAYGTTGA